MLALLLAVQIVPLLNAHAHNDYEHPHPLFDALAQGFTSVEADVYLVDGRLLVAHNRKELNPERSLRKLYLDPLRRIIKEKGAVYPGIEFTLMIDVKADGPAATRELIKELEPMREMISTLIPRQIKIVVSGARDAKVIADESFRLLSADGHAEDLNLPRDRNIAWVSADWTREFKWNGLGEMPDEERQKLFRWVASAHQRGYRLRFWATPEQPALWEELLNAGVDLIGTDRLVDFARYFRTKR